MPRNDFGGPGLVIGALKIHLLGLVELVGLEPTTSSLRTKRSTILPQCLCGFHRSITVHYGPN